VRNGRLVKAGIGIRIWRLPGDVVVRFTSTIQRVSFAAEALSKERLRVSIEGFVLWSLAQDGEGALRAYRKLGVVNLDAPPRDLKSTKHLLSTPQHRAFQQLLAAAVQRLVAAKPLEDLLLDQDTLLAELRGELATLEPELGIRVEQIQLLRIRPVDEALLRLADEANATQLANAVRAREELAFATRLDQIRREAEAKRDAISAVASAEETKSQAVRDHELATLVAEKVGDALKGMPLRDARWITVGPDSPAASLMALITAARELTATAAGKAS
jgi:regulator of protease activity HflC (stomatin/prohibitin superfamily)